MPRALRNVYRVSVELNRFGKYEVRLEARYGSSGWTLRVYFVVGTAERLAARVPSVLRYLQKNEEELWMWGSNASDRGLLFEELLERAGLELDRRREFPRAATVLTARPGEPLRPLQFAELRRKLAARLRPPARVARRPAEALRSA